MTVNTTSDNIVDGCPGDGELVACPGGVMDSYALAAADVSQRAHGSLGRESGPGTFAAFDRLHLDGQGLTGCLWSSAAQHPAVFQPERAHSCSALPRLLQSPGG